MPSNRQTSVVLTSQSMRLKNKISRLFGMKTIFSAGVLWFNELSTDLKLEIKDAVSLDADLIPLIEKAIAELAEKRGYVKQGSPAAPMEPAGSEQETVHNAFAKIKSLLPQSPDVIRILDDEEQKWVDEMRKSAKREIKKAGH